MNPWDLRTFLRALGATIIAIVVVWLVTAASDEGQLTVGVRAGRTLPLAPLCSAVGAALALGTSRVRDETRALEALGRSPGSSARAAVLGAALPSVLVALAILALSSVDVAGFYPRPPRADAYVYYDHAFASPSLGIRVTEDGELHALEATSLQPGDPLPAHARTSAALATGIAGVALALMTARATLSLTLVHRRERRRRRLVAAAQGFAAVLFTVVAFQAAAARISPAALAMTPPALLLGITLFGYRTRHVSAT